MKKYIPVETCEECDKYFVWVDRSANLAYCGHPELCAKEVDPNTIHKDCPLNDLLDQKIKLTQEQEALIKKMCQMFKGI